MISLGTFNSDENGVVNYYAEFDDIPLLEYRFFVISVESVPDPDQADPRRTIAGVFPNTRLEVVSGTSTPTLGPGITTAPGAPGGLPVTGSLSPFTVTLVFWLTAGILLAGLGITLRYRKQ
jgi:hypothetical protein